MNIKFKGHDLIIDDEDYELFVNRGWYINNGKRNSTPYLQGGRPKHELFHRIIMKLEAGDKRQIDHKNGNGLDNRKDNLRIADNGKNQSNCKKYKTYKGLPTSSKYKGVVYRKQGNKYEVRVRVNKKLIRIGLYKLESDAAKAYNNAAMEYFGEFACLNKV